MQTTTVATRTINHIHHKVFSQLFSAKATPNETKENKKLMPTLKRIIATEPTFTGSGKPTHIEAEPAKKIAASKETVQAVITRLIETVPEPRSGL